MPSSASRSVTSVTVKMGGWAATLVDSRNVKRCGMCLLSKKRFQRVRDWEWVTIDVESLTSVKRGQSRMMCEGSRVCEPHGHQRVSGGSEGWKHVVYDPVNAWSTASWSAVEVVCRR